MAASDPTEVPGDVPDDSVDELYGVPLDEFTPRRDALARELRNGGEREAAAWVKALRKPSTAAWIVNQLSRARPREKRELLRAGDALRTAHERLVGGQGDADELRSAMDAEHAAAQALLADASGFLDRTGHSPSASTLEKVAQTIRAVALDEEARAGFELARLTRERSASGFGPLGAGASPPAKSAGRARARKGGTRRATPGGDSRAQEERERWRAAVQKARTTKRERAEKLKVAERDVASAERDAERSMRRLERARADAERARARLADAESRLADAEREAKSRRS